MPWWIGSAKSGREFEVRDAVLALGGYAWVAREFATVRPPTKRRHVAVVRPLQGMGRYEVIQCTDDQWHKLREVKHLSATLLPVSDAAAARYLLPFMDRIDSDYATRAARFDAGEKLAAYQPGDALKVLAGPFADKLATFARIVEGATDLEDKLMAEIPFLGGKRLVPLDPLHVAKVAAE